MTVSDTEIRSSARVIEEKGTAHFVAKLHIISHFADCWEILLYGKTVTLQWQTLSLSTPRLVSAWETTIVPEYGMCMYFGMRHSVSSALYMISRGDLVTKLLEQIAELASSRLYLPAIHNATDGDQSTLNPGNVAGLPYCDTMNALGLLLAPS